MLHATINDIQKGIIPRSGDALVETARNIVAFERARAQALAVTLAAAKKELSTTRLVILVREELKISACHFSHLLQVGGMLLGFTNGDCCMQQYERLFKLPFNSLLALARIPADELVSFLAANRVEAMDREAVRRAVRAWLGEEAKAKTQGELPGLGQLLDFLNDRPDQAEQALAEVADNRERAQRTMVAGLGLAGGGLAYFKRNPAEADVVLLQTARAGLLEEAAEIEELLKELNS